MEIFQKIVDMGVNKTYYAFDESGKLIYQKLTFQNNKNENREIFYKYNAEGKLIHSKDTNGYEVWWEYDEHGHEKVYKNSSRRNRYSKYNPEGKLLWRSTRKDGENADIYRYDEKGNLIYSKTFYGEEWREYNEDGKEIYRKGSSGTEMWFEYNAKGKLMIITTNYEKVGESINWEKGISSDIRFVERIFRDEARKILRSIDDMGYEKIHKYDDRNNLIYRKKGFIKTPKSEPWMLEDEGSEEWWEYNDQNEETYHKDKFGKERRKTYDAYGNEISCKHTYEGEQYSVVKAQYLYYEQLTDDTEWLFPFEPLKHPR
ncbi:hypothetical protein OOZ15_15715 [Galbibacter sp. EGI 63066]|uniref:hypothetical protein n=1 Tax=Galbibacter sp. EGI 63066 TaxID=2993559 RepID=UPI0022492928|nr:hypothetical protein [Galbibacter sp. EGI 63066]MCX2681401.1 hypothetical protein [Galbibacter sp. EGI 63066]